MDGRAARYLVIPLVLAGAGGAALAFRPQAAEPEGQRALLVFTEVVREDGVEPDWRFPARSRIAALDLADPDAVPAVLTADFAAARAPDIHFGGRRMVFAGRREADGPWQIWEMDLRDGGVRLLVPWCERCTDPVYRADDGVVFVAPAGPDRPLATYTVGPDGGEPDRITHHPVGDAALGLVSDGRVIVATGAPAPGRAPVAYYALRHDGTGVELMYRSRDGGALQGRVHETVDRELVFVEDPPDAPPRVVSVSQAYPGTSRRERFAPEGRLHSVFPAADGALVVSLRRGTDRYGLWMVTDGAPAPLFASDELDAVEPVLAAPRDRPLGFVSATSPDAATGTVYGTDARLTGLADRDPSAAVLRVRTPDGPLGEVPLDPDGSFHVELPADRPLQLETRDADGNLVRGPSAWIWVRPGELRGCVGCHEDRALAPPNRLPAAAGRPPVVLPAGDPDGVAEEGDR